MVKHVLFASILALAVGTAAPAGASPSPAAEPPAGVAEASAPAAAAAQLTQEDLQDLSVNFAQPDFTIVALPTTLRAPRHRSAFRVTHRFLRPVNRGGFGSLLENFFGFDSGAIIGLEYRFGLARGLQIGVHRASDRTIQLFGQRSLVRQTGETPVGVDVLVTLEGRNNLREDYSPAVGVLLSREAGDRFAAYLEPIWVGNSNLGDTGDQNTLVLGLGARARVRPTVYLVAELAPRLAGHNPGSTHASVGIEKRAGGHSFQINFSNGFGTTMAKVARGGLANNDVYIGFNISRKFF